MMFKLCLWSLPELKIGISRCILVTVSYALAWLLPQNLQEKGNYLSLFNVFMKSLFIVVPSRDTNTILIWSLYTKFTGGRTLLASENPVIDIRLHDCHSQGNRGQWWNNYSQTGNPEIREGVLHFHFNISITMFCVDCTNAIWLVRYEL